MPRTSCLSLVALAIVLYPLASMAADEPSPRVAAESGAEAASSGEPEKSESKADSKPEVVCWMEAELGSRVKKKVCRQRSDIEASSRNTQDVLRDVRSLGNKNFNASPGS